MFGWLTVTRRERARWIGSRGEAADHVEMVCTSIAPFILRRDNQLMIGRITIDNVIYEGSHG